MIDFDDAPSSGSGSGRPARNPNVFSSVPWATGPDAVNDDLEVEPPPYITALNDRQREAALATEGPLIVIAGAGSGKTKMLTSRMTYLIDRKRVPPWAVLAVTFTNKAAGEMRERVEKALHAAGSTAIGSPEIGTFHSVCVRLLRREQARTPFTKPFVIYDDSDQLSLIKAAFNKLSIDDKSVSPKAVQALINRAKCDALEPHEIDPSPHNFFEKQAKRVYELYQQDLFANNALDFGEIINMAYRLLRDHDDIRQKYQNRYRYIHVDEYQDTNRSQYLFLTQLASTKFGGHQNICVVGDEDQSIYKWRGADIKNILDFENEYVGAKMVKLEQNYRSTQTIIKAAGAVISNNRTRKEKTLWTENPVGDTIIRALVPDERAEAELVVGEIKRIAEEDERGFADFSIFYRTNAQSRQFEDVFRREKIPYQIVGGLRFYDRKEIKDVISYFKVVLNPADSVSMKRIINVPARGIGKTTLDKLDAYYVSNEAAGKNYWEVLHLAANDGNILTTSTGKKLLPFTRLIERLTNEQPKLLLSELYHLILDETGYVRDLRTENTEESLSRIENLEEFDTLLQEFEETFFANVTENEREAKKIELLPLFLEQSALASEGDQQNPNAGAVKMMTLHSSKGLEFPVVFMVGMEEGLFPSIKKFQEPSDEDIEEERRLCYVGMTRAREHLYMLSVSMRRIWGNSHFNDPSRFFDEMPEEMVDFRDLSKTRSRMDSASRYGSGSGREPAYDEVSQVHDYGGSQRDLVGQKLRHPEYGMGTVILSEGSGHDQKVTVEFKGKDRRKFLLRYLASFFER